MTHPEPVHELHETSLLRRDFLRNSILLALPVMATAVPAAAAVSMSSPLPAMRYSAYRPPLRARGGAEVNVRNRGARGDGVHDDTAAFQNAIDALPSGGGTVHVPAGTYLIDPTVRVRLRSRMHLHLASDAVLKAKRNAATRAYVLTIYKVSDVEISGGEIEGDRDRHLGTTGEWGHGIMVRGSSRVTIRDMLIRKCWGDGISIAATTPHDPQPGIPSVDIVLANVACIGNRRQGMSVGRSQRVKVYDSEFSYTSGTGPQCGIDIESDLNHPNASDMHIENCLFRHNKGNGIQIYKRADGITVKRCVIEYNGGYGVLAIEAKRGYLAQNQLRHNYLQGVMIRARTRNYQVSGNTFRNNHTRMHGVNPSNRTPAAKAITGLVGGNHGTGANILVTNDTSDIRVTTNFYAK